MSKTTQEIRQIMQNCGSSLRAQDFKDLIDWIVQQFDDVWDEIDKIWLAINIIQNDITDIWIELAKKLEDAPFDGIIYGRQNGMWVPAGGSSSGIGDAPNDGNNYVREFGQWNLLSNTLISDAIYNNYLYTLIDDRATDITNNIINSPTFTTKIDTIIDNNTNVIDLLEFMSFNDGVNYVNTLTGLPINKSSIVASVNTLTETISLAATTLKPGRAIHMQIYNAGSGDVEVNLPSAPNYVLMTDTPVELGPGEYGEVRIWATNVDTYSVKAFVKADPGPPPPPPTWFNVYTSRVFTKNDCPPGHTGSTENVEVLAGTFSSLISQADADLQAETWLDVNGQNAANTQGVCTLIPVYYSAVITDNVQKDDCTPPAIGSIETVSTTYGQFTSTVSQAAADALAQAWFDANKQNLANTQGTCIMPTPDIALAFTTQLFRDGIYRIGAIIQQLRFIGVNPTMPNVFLGDTITLPTSAQMAASWEIINDYKLVGWVPDYDANMHTDDTSETLPTGSLTPWPSGEWQGKTILAPGSTVTIDSSVVSPGTVQVPNNTARFISIWEANNPHAVLTWTHVASAGGLPWIYNMPDYVESWMTVPAGWNRNAIALSPGEIFTVPTITGVTQTDPLTEEVPGSVLLAHLAGGGTVFNFNIAQGKPSSWKWWSYIGISYNDGILPWVALGENVIPYDQQAYYNANVVAPTVARLLQPGDTITIGTASIYISPTIFWSRGY